MRPFKNRRRTTSWLVSCDLKGSKGFTLLELIISLTIVAVILVIVFGAFRIGIKAWEKGERDIEKHQRYRIVLEMINRQMASIMFKKVKRSDKEELLLKGDGKSFEFASRVSMKPANEFGIVFVKYSVAEVENEGEGLFAYEKNFVLFDEEFSFDDIDPDEFFALIPQAHAVSFEYLKPPEEGLEEEPQWVKEWDPANEKGVPMAVKLTVVEEPEATPFEIIAPIYQEMENS